MPLKIFSRRIKEIYLVHFNFLSVRVDGECLSFNAVTGLDLTDDDGAHVGVLVNDRHHERPLDIALVSTLESFFSSSLTAG